MVEKKIIRLISILFLSLTVLIVTGLFYLPDLRAALSDYFDKKGNRSMAEFFADEKSLGEREMTVVMTPEESAPPEDDDVLRFSVALPDKAYANASDMSVSYDYLTKTLKLVIPGADEDYFAASPVTGPSARIEEISMEPGPLCGTIDIVTDKVYEVACLYDSSFLYIDFQDPHEVYDYVVVVDPGHGGSMPGTVKSGYSEKDINLAIALKLKKLLERSDLNIGVFYTRTTDVDPDFSVRVGLANDCEADAFVSIHNNSLTGRGKSSTSGVQALYNTADKESLELSRILVDAVSSGTGAQNRGTVNGDDIYIVSNSRVPVSLVEVGFMTNAAELRLLASDKYQQQVATALCSGIEKWLKEQ